MMEVETDLGGETIESRLAKLKKAAQGHSRPGVENETGGSYTMQDRKTRLAEQLDAKRLDKIDDLPLPTFPTTFLFFYLFIKLAFQF